jgi:hypothetical protein
MTWIDDDPQGSGVPVLGSVSMAVLELPVVFPPGLMVQVVAVVAMAVGVPTPSASAAAVPLRRSTVRCLRM